jgi:glc operon protein GlcG
MRKIALTLLAICAAVVAAGQASAQAPTAPPAPPSAGGTPDQLPFDIPYGPSVTIEQAKHAAAAATAEARKGNRNWKIAITVVDPAGELVYFEKMDGTQLASVKISQGKAMTAARYRRESRVFYNAFETGHGYVSTLDPTLVASPGGFPLVSDGKLIGAIGCSGGTGDQDAATCKAGAEAIANQVASKSSK